MLIDEIKKANMQALRDKDQARRAAYSVLINKYMLLNIQNREAGKETTDAEVVGLIQKMLKELSEEKDMYTKGGNAERVKSTETQIDAVKKFLPQMMSEEEIRTVIGNLPDKSLKSVMAHFKENYQGKADMGLVSRIARTFAG